MTGAPSAISAEQLQELKIEITAPGEDEGAEAAG
jgi:hypothetical protein